ncbi:MAG: helix-turn-helix domain-containing protein [Microcystis aeruginosa BS13-02]|jgi:AraC family ethanolamine operon transcriptional activator|uniref:Helix-turn-helix domain-containing protein n=1 Tax=Microcystis aeruginosa Ma_MB_S_20031200_S102 TaxID=2486254 RepID=A0A552EGW3_MICAE|nr:helix-turn-helix domain-containing protein [Microcystis aeruginosa BS13-02]TRU22849.1 MAG: helix-turn-helix domain-containing protein [Microcystis aeruginosa Ma_MB_S_20031200_S102D]TRU33728.1 MAG: helix-turn-helix domain-containing protein [Microcystis aeruginosa Ma_MB_S_20031200_S102]
MFIFDSKTNILINSQELTFKSEYFCNFSRYFQNREFVNLDALQLSGDHFEGYLSRIIIDEVMLELSQRNCLTNVKGVTHSKMWVFAIPFQVNPVLFQNLYSLENNYLGIVPPKSEISVFQHPFSNRFQLYVDDDYLQQLCQTLELPEAKKFLNSSISSIVICPEEKIRHLQQSCHQLYQMLFNLDRQQISERRKVLKLNFVSQKLKEEIVKDFLLTLAATKDIKTPKNTIRRTSILKKAEEMMRENLRSDLSISTICQYLEVSERTLEYIFKDFYQMSPYSYFKLLRLNVLYQSLNQNNQTKLVYEIAEELGFFHRGYLASDYKKIFGYFPSET